ncbi:hypothetical protein C2I18_23250 [Paenibacillus sp. PK3_47]|uniref:YczE/YyaS/YitT family protein n=1 Tax=Paenibacillus sp. PK3_47 TaxID=2072642 RepID=UPI00201DAFB7|nr:YitT family protein [Paenibacillus sp. PK3_47]UQZ36181.1 hypothetical protein C2I18_23250 [Paenibacillus sp. PK3_47]
MSNTAARFSLYVSGIIILSLGITLTIQSSLGVSPYDALLVGLSQQAGLTIGSWEVILAFIMIFSNALMVRQMPEFSGLLTAFITGLGIDLWHLLVTVVLQPEHLIGRISCLAAGLVLIGLGTAVYLHARFAPIPLDRLMLILRQKTGMSILSARTAIYVVFLAMAALLQGPIGPGTLATVLLGGPLLNLFMPYIGSRLKLYSASGKTGRVS